MTLIEAEHPAIRLLGWMFFIPASLYALAAICVAAPWFLRWYFIAVNLMFGRHAMADRKETELVLQSLQPRRPTGDMTQPPCPFPPLCPKQSITH